MMKTYENWKGNLDDYLQIGDEVDDEMVNHFIGVMPPATMRSDCIQIGEPHSHVNENGKCVPTFATIKRESGKWIWKGNLTIKQSW